MQSYKNADYGKMTHTWDTFSARIRRVKNIRFNLRGWGIVVAICSKLRPGDSMRFKLNQKRLDLGWSIRHLEEMSGVSRATISRLENCDCNPSVDILYKLACAMGVALDDLILHDE